MAASQGQTQTLEQHEEMQITNVRAAQVCSCGVWGKAATGWGTHIPLGKEARTQMVWPWAPASFKFLILSQRFVLIRKLLLLKASLCAWRIGRPNNAETSAFGAEKGLLQGHARRTGGLCPKKTPNSPTGLSKLLLKARWGRGVVGCCELLGAGILCSCSCPCRSGHNVPVNLNKTNVILCSATLYCSRNVNVLYP